jgi:hypothetical protein
LESAMTVETAKKYVRQVRTCEPPPDDFDPFTADGRELAQHGYPRRPDRENEPPDARYAAWWHPAGVQSALESPWAVRTRALRQGGLSAEHGVPQHLAVVVEVDQVQESAPHDSGRPA